MIRRPPRSTLVPSTALFRSVVHEGKLAGLFTGTPEAAWSEAADLSAQLHIIYKDRPYHTVLSCAPPMYDEIDRKSTRLNSSHANISYAVFCLKKKIPFRASL